MSVKNNPDLFEFFFVTVRNGFVIWRFVQIILTFCYSTFFTTKTCQLHEIDDKMLIICDIMVLVTGKTNF